MVSAYILITAEPGKAGEVVTGVARTTGVKSVSAVTGPYDAIAQIEVDDFNTLGNLVVSQIQNVSGVTRTLTCIAVEL